MCDLPLVLGPFSEMLLKGHASSSCAEAGTCLVWHIVGCQNLPQRSSYGQSRCGAVTSCRINSTLIVSAHVAHRLLGHVICPFNERIEGTKLKERSTHPSSPCALLEHAALLYAKTYRLPNGKHSMFQV